jgi:hypothetical protein
VPNNQLQYSCVQFWGVSVIVVCITCVVGWLLDWLQQVGERVVHNVGYKIIKGLKYELSLSKISQHILISNLLHVSALFSIITKYNSFRTVTALHSIYQHKNDIPPFRSTVHIKMLVSSDLYYKSILCEILLKYLSIFLCTIAYYK